MKRISAAFRLLLAAVQVFIADAALSRGPAIAFYTATSFTPLLLIVIAIAGIAFGREAAEHAIVGQMNGLMGRQTADILQNALSSAAGKSSGIIATIIGVVTLVAIASGVFSEIRAALNAIWRAQPKGSTLSRLVRARAASIGLVAALGFLLIVSLVISAALSAFATMLNAVLPFGDILLAPLNTIISVVLLSVLIAASYKVLPDRRLKWGDVFIWCGRNRDFVHDRQVGDRLYIGVAVQFSFR